MLPCLKFPIKELFGQSVVWHADHMTSPPWLSLYENAVNAREVCFGEHLSVRNLILPFDVEEVSETHSVEVVQLVGMADVYGPDFASIQQGWNHYSLVDL